MREKFRAEVRRRVSRFTLLNTGVSTVHLDQLSTQLSVGLSLGPVLTVSQHLSQSEISIFCVDQSGISTFCINQSEISIVCVDQSETSIVKC